MKKELDSQGQRVAPAPSLLLVDDDPVFGKMMAEVARREDVSIEYFTSVREAYKKIRTGEIDFDVAILDYNLGSVTGIQLAHFIDSQQKSRHVHHCVSVILVSHLGAINSAHSPVFVKRSLDKREGPYKILMAAIEEVSRLNEGK